MSTLSSNLTNYTRETSHNYKPFHILTIFANYTRPDSNIMPTTPLRRLRSGGVNGIFTTSFQV